jgi:hypothetical protein
VVHILEADLYSDKDSSGIRFANDVLKFKLKTDHAVKTGNVFSVNENFSHQKLNLNLIQHLMIQFIK